MRRSVIVSSVRTPVGKYGGAFKSLPAVDLGASVLENSVHRAEIEKEEVEGIMLGMVLQGGAGQIPSRQAARKAGFPWEVQSETINKVCASGLRAVTLADQIIRSGDAHVLIAGGMENMSQAPHVLPQARWGVSMGDASLQDLMVHDGLTCAFEHVHMAVHGSTIAQEYKISRQEQDEWALRSHERAIHAIDNGLFGEEIVPVTVPKRKGETVIVDEDEAPRRDTSLSQLSALSPIFMKDGTITAGNAPGVNDGAAALVIMSEQQAKAKGKTPLAQIIGHAAVGDQAPYLARTPASAIQKCLKQTGYRLDQIDLFEINEAFAAVTLTSGKILDLDFEKVNVNGGAVALGHPIGASGARILTTLIHALRKRGGGLGVAAICSGAAQGDAILIKVD